jgi:LysM repeat protein
LKVKKTIFAILASVAVMATTVVLITISNESSQSSFRYTIQAGDTCGKIAWSLGVSVISIIKENHLQSDCRDIHLGQVLSIPQSTPTPRGLPSMTGPNIVVHCERVAHRVVDGDTLVSIANQYEIPKEAISFFNGLEGDTVEPGTQLIIPLCYNTPYP